MKQAIKNNLNTLKNVVVDNLTSAIGAKSSVTSVSGAIHSLADVDIHSITDEVSRAFGRAEIGTWAYNPSVNYALYQASMVMNRNEKETTLSIIGTDAMTNGDGTVVTANRNQPSETNDIDYISTFQKEAEISEKVYGEDTTQTESYSYNNGYYSGSERGELTGVRHNDLYSQSYDLYYDDDNRLNRSKVSNVILPNNRNSIVYKTKQLFNDNKINTIVSAFHTKVDSPTKLASAITPKYGMSHGRNLLLLSAERGNGNYDIHGYDNPYCRVWTHHYQYNRRDRLIRPFVTFKEGTDRDETESTDIAEFHNFGADESAWKDKDGGYAWKGGNVGWEMSVLHNDSKNGVVNIAPKYSNDPNHKTIKPIDCMFSIENLAWQGYDPYSFQKALSDEQRGPMGGRIMWFPPYDLSFTENVNVDWASHNFIGRGETVHTYKNTTRTGSLSFTLLVDHPSYTDLHLRHEGNIKNGSSTAAGATDTDFLRFFAGCDSGERPKAKIKTDDVPPEIKEEAVVDDLLKFSFYVFYPNNYSGVHDKPGQKVEAIPYLLAGKGAQKQNNLIADGDITEEVDKRSEKINNLKKWLVENYPNQWGITSYEDGAIAKVRDNFYGQKRTLEMLDNFNPKTLLTKPVAHDASDNTLSLYCGHYPSYPDFVERWSKSAETPLLGEVKYSLEDFTELCAAKVYYANGARMPGNIPSTWIDGMDTEFRVMSQRFIYDVFDDVIEHNTDIYDDLDEFWPLKDWTEYNTSAAEDIKNFIKTFFDDCFDKLFDDLSSDPVLKTTLDTNGWKIDLNEVKTDIKKKYIQNALGKDREWANHISDRIKGIMKESFDELGVPLVIEHNGEQFFFHPQDLKEWKSRTGFDFTPYNVYFVDDNSNTPSARGWYHLYFNEYEGGYDVKFISNDKSQQPNPIGVGVPVYSQAESRKKYIDELSVNFSSKSNDFAVDDYADFKKLINMTTLELTDYLEPLAKSYSKPSQELDDYFAGCYFTTPQASDPTKVMVYWYQPQDKSNPEIVAGWHCDNLDTTLEKFTNSNWAVNNGKTDQFTTELLHLYYDYYYGMLILLGLVDEQSAKKIQEVLKAKQPKQSDVISKIDSYNATIEKVTSRRPYTYYTMLGPTREKDEELAQLASEIRKYVSGETEDLTAITTIIEDYTPTTLCDAITEMFSHNLVVSSNYDDWAANDGDKNSFSEMIDVVFTTLYEFENTNKNAQATSDFINYKNATEVDDEKSDIAISMGKLFEADGVGYEMMKIVNPLSVETPTYEYVRQEQCAYGISNVQRETACSSKDAAKSIVNQSVEYCDTDAPTNNRGTFPLTAFNPNMEWKEISDNHIKGTRPNWQQYKGNTYIPSNSSPKQKNWDGYDYIPWYYRIDGKYTVPNVKNETEIFENYYDQLLKFNRIDKVKNNRIIFSNYRDSMTYGLNCDIEMVKAAFQIKDSDLTSNKETLYSLAEVAYTVTDNPQIRTKIEEQGLILTVNDAANRISNLEKLLKASKNEAEGNDYEIVKIEALGYSNSHANNKSITVNTKRNEHLATNRAKTVIEWFKQNLPNMKDEVYEWGVTNVESSPSTDVGAEPDGVDDVSSLKAKQYRSAKVTIYVKQNNDKDYVKATRKFFDLGGGKVYIDTTQSLEIDGMQLAPTSDGKHYYHIKDNSIWEYGKDGKLKKTTVKKTTANDKDKQVVTEGSIQPDILRYDNENRFFRELQIEDPIVFARLVDKLQVFDPAFHSMTPEGFNARLTFLHQCTRQGDTHTLSDTNRVHTPKNLQFGKAPICVLRLGDFYHQQIVIKTLGIKYEPLTWDLNTEGIGVQPMLAKIDLSFEFIGGGDLAGAVQRLQNAATFNYYANTRLYDNRADRVKYEDGNNGVIDTVNTYSHNVPYAGIDTRKR